MTSSTKSEERDRQLAELYAEVDLLGDFACMCGSCSALVKDRIKALLRTAYSRGRLSRPAYRKGCRG